MIQGLILASKCIFEYLSDWKENIEERPGQFALNAKDRMFISCKKYEGIRISVHSAIEAKKYLLT